MKIGSMFAGIGGAELALSQVFPDAHPVWQNDLVNHQVRARHWPDALQIVQDVRTVNAKELPQIDLLTAGFPCQDLSCANNKKDKGGLDGKRSGLYREVLRFSQTIRPQFVLMENVSALLPLLGRLSADFREMGYGLTWTVCEALDAGLPHHRRRVFVLAELDTNGRGLVDVDQSAQWRHDTLRTWLTATATDHKTPAGFIRTNHPPTRIGEQLFSEQGRRVNPDWMELFMGYPMGWTDTNRTDKQSHKLPDPVKGRYPIDYDCSVRWHGFEWEPERTLPNEPKFKGWVDRIKAIGNAWAPAQGALAVRALFGRPKQQSLFA